MINELQLTCRAHYLSFVICLGSGQNTNLIRKNKAAVNLKTGRFDNINSAVIISSVCKAVQNCKFCTAQFCTALHTLLMMTAEFMLSKRPVLRFTAALFFLLKLFSSHIYCITNLIIKHSAICIVSNVICKQFNHTKYESDL